MWIIGLFAAWLLGLLVLFGLEQIVFQRGVSPFLLPVPLALPIGLATGIFVTYILGRWLGLLQIEQIRNYELLNTARGRVLRAVRRREEVADTEIDY